MAVAINNSWMALDFIPQVQRQLDDLAGGGRRFQIHRVCAYATILPFDSELWQQLRTTFDSDRWSEKDRWLATFEALNWEADPDDDLDEMEVLHHLRQQAATVQILSSVISRRDHSNIATTLSGSALSPSIKATTQGRLLSSFHRYSIRQSYLRPKPIPDSRGGAFIGISRRTAVEAFLPHVRHVRVHPNMRIVDSLLYPQSPQPIVWASSQWDDHFMFWQLQVDVVDLLSRRTLPTSRPGNRRRTAFNSFLQVSHSPVVQDTSRGNRPQKYNGVRHRPDRKIWVAEMKPSKHKNKQDFGNFKSEDEGARAVDAAFYHYGKPHLLNFPDTSLQFLSTRPAAPPRLDEKAKVKFVKEEAKLLLAAIAAPSPLHSTPTNSLPFPTPELSASPRGCPSGQFRTFSEISSPSSCSGPDEVDDAVSQPQQWMNFDSVCDISTARLLTNSETPRSVQISGQGWDWTEESTLAALPSAGNSSACEIRSMWLDSLLQSPPAPMYSRSPSPSHFEEEITYALLEQQNLLV